MYYNVIYAAVAALMLQIIGAAQICPNYPNCLCGGTLANELTCNIDEHTIRINLLLNVYINVVCENTTTLDYKKLPKCANTRTSFKSVSFKDCPLPSMSFNDVLRQLGVSKTMSLIYQNANNLSGYFDRKHFAGLQNLTKLLLSINGITHLPDNLFQDINQLTWLNIRSNSVNLSEELFRPLERLETLEISHNHMNNINSNLFSHLSFLRKLSLWQSNVTSFSNDIFTGVDVLEELDLSSNGLNELPISIFKPLKKLKKLTLYSNKFASLPLNLFKSNVNLETAVILNNDAKLKELPKGLFSSLPNLKVIYIQRSGLEILPYDVFADSASITNISLANNDIETLPESIFNDQINLLDLDLSYNQIMQLKPKLFSSLVRLERLNLCYNQLVEISGQTFSSLLSLMYLSIAHNKLKYISSYLFCNNKQRMSITLAYNKLDFEYKEVTNNSWLVQTMSPFANTYNLKLLNLSHNDFKVTLDDWWMNGHENLDISHNSIKNLLADGRTLNMYDKSVKKANGRIWIGENPIKCECRNYLFLDYIQDKVKMKIMDLQGVHCPLWANEACYLRFTISVTLITIVILLYIITITVIVIYRQHISYMLKERFCRYAQTPRTYKIEKHNIMIRYSDIDEEFVFKEILPAMKCNRSLKIKTDAIKHYETKLNIMNRNYMKNFVSCVDDTNDCTVLVVFSSNYLLSTYSHVDIKKIHSEMLKAENAIYIFADIGPENSIYAFLEEQRDVSTSILWKETNFWEKLFAMLSYSQSKGKYIPNYDLLKVSHSNSEARLMSNLSFSKLHDRPNMFDVNTLTHSQV